MERGPPTAGRPLIGGRNGPIGLSRRTFGRPGAVSPPLKAASAWKTVEPIATTGRDTTKKVATASASVLLA